MPYRPRVVSQGGDGTLPRHRPAESRVQSGPEKERSNRGAFQRLPAVGHARVGREEPGAQGHGHEEHIIIC